MKALKSTTALALCAALSIPHPVIAAEHAGVKACGEMPEPPCMLDNGIQLTLGMIEGLAQCPDPLSAEATPCATSEGFLAETSDSTALAEDPVTEEAAQATPEGVAEDAPSEDLPSENLTDQAEAPTATVAADTEAGQPAADAVVSEEQTMSADAKAAETEAQAVDDVSAEASEQPAETAEGTPAEEPAAAETPAAETAGAGETPADAPAEAATVAETEGTTEAVAVIEEEASAAAVAAAATEDTGTASEEVEVATEEVTEDTARSSSEDFATAATGDVSAATSASAGRDKGLSNFEKALLIGLGAVAVGSILKNGDEVVSNSGDRVVLRDETGDLRVLKDDDALLRQPGSQVRTETFNDGSTRTIVTRDDGTRIITIRAADGRVLRRSREFPDGTRVVLFDDTEVSEPVVVSELPQVTRQSLNVDVTDEDALRRALAEAQQDELTRRFSLRQIRQIREVRELAPEIELDAVTFATGSAAIEPSQAEELTALGRAMRRIIDERPGEVFLIEGHTDAVGNATYNLALSDRRAETVALALTEYFDVPPENMITQGYGESALKIDTQEAERLNRRAAVRRITPLLRQAVLDN